jgi:hypothetical protein
MLSMIGVFLMKSAQRLAMCSVLLIIAATGQGVALSAATMPRNIAAMFDEDEMARPVVIRASSTQASAAKGHGQGTTKSAKPRLLTSTAASKPHDSSAKHSNAKAGKEKLSLRQSSTVTNGVSV